MTGHSPRSPFFWAIVPDLDLNPNPNLFRAAGIRIKLRRKNYFRFLPAIFETRPLRMIENWSLKIGHW
jgi:hypothetical protein